DTLDYSAATKACSDLGGYIMMPKTTEEMEFAKGLQNIGDTVKEVWIGLKEINSNGIWIWADGTVASDQGIVPNVQPDEDCARLNTFGIVKDMSCSYAYVTICQREADLDQDSSKTKRKSNSTVNRDKKRMKDYNTGDANSSISENHTDVICSDRSSEISQIPSEEVSTNTLDIMDIDDNPSVASTTSGNIEVIESPNIDLSIDTGVQSCDRGKEHNSNVPESGIISKIVLKKSRSETTSNIDITSPKEITTTNKKTSEGPTTTEADLFGTTSARVSTDTETSVESSTSYIRKSVSPTVSTTKEPVSTVKSETKVMPENVSTALKVSSQVSPVSSKTTEHLQMPTKPTKYADAATAQQTHTQTNRLRPTTISSPIGKSKCTQSSTNSCRCQKRTVANTTENQKMQTLKFTDYIWLNKCTMQPLLDSGIVNVENCPYVCKCSPKGSTTSLEEMFACVRRP
ncbi:Hypothetical predicted protein, partial [Mytilus galloprovincialis]